MLYKYYNFHTFHRGGEPIALILGTPVYPATYRIQREAIKLKILQFTMRT